MSGERGEESNCQPGFYEAWKAGGFQKGKGRAGYEVFEPDDADGRKGRDRRHIDRWRPVLHWSEAQVWELIEKYKINVHPCYRLGWSRCSCAACIFNGSDEFATYRQIMPDAFKKLADYEVDFDRTMKRKDSLPILADKGTAFDTDPAVVKEALDEHWAGPIVISDWSLPPGAFRGGAGPT